MKRFFCVICRKIRRARNLPSNVLTQLGPDGSTMVPVGELSERAGTCVWHALPHGKGRKDVTSRARVVAGYGNTSKTSASSAKSKSKK